MARRAETESVVPVQRRARRATPQRGAAGGWDAEARPYLGFHNAPWQQRLYMSPALDVDAYVRLWQSDGQQMIGGHDPEAIRSEVWPWLLERGVASLGDETKLDQFLRTLTPRRSAHLRAGLRLMKRWDASQVESLLREDRLAEDIRRSFASFFHSIGVETPYE